MQRAGEVTMQIVMQRAGGVTMLSLDILSSLAAGTRSRYFCKIRKSRC
jgi:hypothetical protein